MRSYLTEFFNEFAYERADAEHLLSTYDAIIANEEANALLTQAIAAYDACIDIDYKTEILNRAKQISALTGIHPYTVDLLVCLCLTKRLKSVYLERGIELQIYRDGVLDLKWKLEECKAVKGVCGTFVIGWHPLLFRLACFTLGRLTFEPITANFDYEKNGVKIEKDKTTVISVHIPRTGTPIDKESCDRSYAMAREFFKKQAGENAPFHCNSWLLFPENKQILPPSTNTYRFLSEYDIISWKYNTGGDLWRLFDTDEKHPDRLPADTTFRRCYVEHLKKGGRVGTGIGIKI